MKSKKRTEMFMNTSLYLLTSFFESLFTHSFLNLIRLKVGILVCTHCVQLNSNQLKFIKTGSSKAEHTNNNLYRYSKIYVNINYSTKIQQN